MHDDHGMMQAVETVPTGGNANYGTRDRVASPSMSAEDVSAIYPPPGPALLYRQNPSFVDSSPELGQVLPGFPIEPPTIV